MKAVILPKYQTSVQGPSSTLSSILKCNSQASIVLTSLNHSDLPSSHLNDALSLFYRIQKVLVASQAYPFLVL